MCPICAILFPLVRRIRIGLDEDGLWGKFSPCFNILGAATELKFYSALARAFAIARRIAQDAVIVFFFDFVAMRIIAPEILVCVMKSIFVDIGDAVEEW